MLEAKPNLQPYEILPDLAAEVAALRAIVRELLAAAPDIKVGVADTDLVPVNHRQKVLADARNRAAKLVQEGCGET